MVQQEFGVVLPVALWPQGDARDPLGVWVVRHGITGDGAPSVSVKVIFQVPAGLAAAYLYTCYSVNFAQISGVIASAATKIRLLTNWPNADLTPGVQAYSSLLLATANGDNSFSAPNMGFQTQPLSPNDRFLLLFDPRPSAGSLDIVEIEFGDNVAGNVYSFEGYGYFWDRSVLNAPGGPRHPGSS